MLPQDIIDETVKAFSVSATSATGYGSLGPPSGRYIAPADSFDCIETIRGEGECGLQSVVVTGPAVQAVRSQHRQADRDRRPRQRRVPPRRAERVRQRQLLAGQRAHDHEQPRGRRDADVYEVTALTGVNTARVLQIVSRIRW